MTKSDVISGLIWLGYRQTRPGRWEKIGGEPLSLTKAGTLKSVRTSEVYGRDIKQRLVHLTAQPIRIEL